MLSENSQIKQSNACSLVQSEYLSDPLSVSVQPRRHIEIRQLSSDNFSIASVEENQALEDIPSVELEAAIDE